jgi:hypothetical protein
MAHRSETEVDTTMTRLGWLYQIILATCLLQVAPVLAEPVSVNRGTGLGYVFQHRGNCYLILPQHVHGRQTRLSLITAAPSAVGDAVVFRTFAPELDLSIAVVASGLDHRCGDSFAALSADIQPLLDTSTDVQLVRVDAGGAERRDAMIITAVDFETITARPLSADRAAEIYEGSSGGMLRAGDTILGMAIQSTGIEEATFLRIDEIVARLGRLLDARAAGTLPDEPIAPNTPPVATGQCATGAIALRLVTCSVEPISPEVSCANLLTAGAEPVAFDPAGIAPRIVFDLAVDKPVPISAVTLEAPADDPQFAVPKQIAVEVSSTPDTPRWRKFAGAVDMSPLGNVRITNGAAPYANRIAVTLLSSWDPVLPPALLCVSID